jgi:hypothetical protein
MQSCAHIVLDTADTVRDGDFSPIVMVSGRLLRNETPDSVSVYEARLADLTAASRRQGLQEVSGLRIAKSRHWVPRCFHLGSARPLHVLREYPVFPVL